MGLDEVARRGELLDRDGLGQGDLAEDLLLLLVLAAALTATSCSKKITDVDVALSPPDYPEGVPASADSSIAIVPAHSRPGSFAPPAWWAAPTQ